MARITITVEEAERQALIELAQKERRDPRDQAALIIRGELERRGLLFPQAAAATAIKSDREGSHAE